MKSGSRETACKALLSAGYWHKKTAQCVSEAKKERGQNGASNGDRGAVFMVHKRFHRETVPNTKSRIAAAKAGLLTNAH